MGIFGKVKEFIDKIKGEVFDTATSKEVEEFRAYTRQQKRSLVLTVNGEEIKALRYIDRLAAKLPMIQLKATKEIIDHRAELREIYMDMGHHGITKYVDKINYFIQNAA